MLTKNIFKNMGPQQSPTMVRRELGNLNNPELLDKQWMQSVVDASEPALSPNERTSLSAMISYVAHKAGENEFSVERRLSDRFNIPNVLCLPASEYDNALRYLTASL